MVKQEVWMRAVDAYMRSKAGIPQGDTQVVADNASKFADLIVKAYESRYAHYEPKAEEPQGVKTSVDRSSGAQVSG